MFPCDVRFFFIIIILLLFLLFTGLISSVLWRDRRSGPPEYYFMLLVVWNRRLRISLMIWVECSHELYNQCSIDRCERNQSISVCGRKPKRHQERCDYRRRSQRDTEASCGPSVHGFSFHFFLPFFFRVFSCLVSYHGKLERKLALTTYHVSAMDSVDIQLRHQ